MGRTLAAICAILYLSVETQAKSRVLAYAEWTVELHDPTVPIHKGLMEGPAILGTRSLRKQMCHYVCISEHQLERIWTYLLAKTRVAAQRPHPRET